MVGFVLLFGVFSHGKNWGLKQKAASGEQRVTRVWVSESGSPPTQDPAERQLLGKEFDLVTLTLPPTLWLCT